MTEHVEEPRKHAVLSASGSHIWLHCTPAARFQEQFPDQETEFSKEGTWAHEVGAADLRVYLGGNDGADVEDARALVDSEGSEDAKKWATAPNLEAISAYVQRCIGRIEMARKKTPDAVILLEQRLDFSRWVPEGFGTGDLVIVADDILDVVDLKFGKGVQVEAEDNPQLKLYALGAIAQYAMLYGFTHVRVTIDQPRRNHVVSTEPMPVAELIAWGDNYVRERAARAWQGNGEFTPGDHCTFCRGRAVCAARKKHLDDVIDLAFDEGGKVIDTDILTDEQIAAILPLLDQLQKWAKNLQAHALKAALAGKTWPDHKLVLGRANRKITDPSGLAVTLEMEGFPRALLFEPPAPPALLGLGALESLMGKKKFAELSSGFVKKPLGKPTLVPASDKREAYVPSDADNEFSEEEDEE